MHHGTYWLLLYTIESTKKKIKFIDCNNNNNKKIVEKNTDTLIFNFNIK